MSEDIVRVLRILEYIGPRNWVEGTLSKCAVPINGEYSAGKFGIIKSAMLGTTLEIVEAAKERNEIISTARNSTSAAKGLNDSEVVVVRFNNAHDADKFLVALGDLNAQNVDGV